MVTLLRALGCLKMEGDSHHEVGAPRRGVWRSIKLKEALGLGGGVRVAQK